MGIIRLFSNSTDNFSVDPRNPDPFHFEVKEEVKFDNCYVSLVNYPNCTTYEGNKILVTRKSISKVICLDPHFNENSTLIARFSPTTEGWKLALNFAKNL